MKTARFLLACAAASVLAACGSETITAPTAAPARPHADGTTGTTDSSNSICIKVTIYNADGTTTEVCVYDANGQLGSGL